MPHKFDKLCIKIGLLGDQLYQLCLTLSLPAWSCSETHYYYIFMMWRKSISIQHRWQFLHLLDQNSELTTEKASNQGEGFKAKLFRKRLKLPHQDHYPKKKKEDRNMSAYQLRFSNVLNKCHCNSYFKCIFKISHGFGLSNF